MSVLELRLPPPFSPPSRPLSPRISANSSIYLTIIFFSGETSFMQGRVRPFSRLSEGRVAGKVERNFVLYMSTWNGGGGGTSKISSNFKEP